jgi:hypothetical protein
MTVAGALSRHRLTVFPHVSPELFVPCVRLTAVRDPPGRHERGWLNGYGKRIR